MKKRYIAEVQYNDEYQFAADCENPQEFIDHFINNGSNLDIEDLGMLGETMIEKIKIYETDEDGEPIYDESVAEWSWS